LIQNKNVDFMMPDLVQQNIPNFHKNKNWVTTFFPLSLLPAAV